MKIKYKIGDYMLHLIKHCYKPNSKENYTDIKVGDYFDMMTHYDIFTEIGWVKLDRWYNIIELPTKSLYKID